MDSTTRTGPERFGRNSGSGETWPAGKLADEGKNVSQSWLPHQPASQIWLTPAPDAVMAHLSVPEPGATQSTAILMCPAFGWEEMCSYRRLRGWAQALAQAGYPTARIELPASGNSGGVPGDPQRLDAWTRAVSEAAGWLGGETGCERVTAIGIGLGGMIACRAASTGAAIDDLVLWSVPARGRVLLREMGAYASIVAARNPKDAEGPPPPNGALNLIGYLLSAETVRDLQELELTELALPRAAGRRVLLLGRDGLPVDRRLRAHLAHPEELRTPHTTVAATLAWLGEGSTASHPAPALEGAHHRVTRTTERVRKENSQELVHDGRALRETPLWFDVDDTALFGVLTEPVSSPGATLCGVLLGAGVLRHTGPNRAWVEVARRWASRGVPTVRVDLAGIGESDEGERRYTCEADLFAPDLIKQPLAVLEWLSRDGLPPRFVLCGLCSGAYWALHAALADDRVAGALMINLYPFLWSDELVAEYETRRSLRWLRGRAWKRLLRGDVTAAQLRMAISGLRSDRLRAIRGETVESSQTPYVNGALDRLRDQGTEALVLLCEREPLYDQLAREGQLDQLARWPNLTIERIPSRDHMFRALWLQHHVHACLDRALDRVLAATFAEDRVPSS
jgi:alpha-beta hydrolase superfamily lysophospholipase